MLSGLIGGLHLIHVVFFGLGAVALFKFWKRTRFWLPKYAHVLAAVGLLVGIGVVLATPPDAPIAKQGLTVRALFALVIPAIVYFFFIAYGGQKAAFKRTLPRSAPCPYCQHPLLMQEHSTNVLAKRCPNCDRLLP